MLFRIHFFENYIKKKKLRYNAIEGNEKKGFHNSHTYSDNVKFVE